MDSGITAAETPEAELQSQAGARALAAAEGTMISTALRVCGQSAMRFGFREEINQDLLDIEDLAVAAESSGTVYVAHVVLMGSIRGNTQNQRDVDTIMGGFQMVLRDAVNS